MVSHHEPERFARTAKFLLPKDYLRFVLTGEMVTEMSDAAGTLWLDGAKRCWSDKLLSACGLSTDHMPDVIVGSKIWEGEWAEGRAKAYGITVEELPEFYAKRNLLHEIIYPEDIANGVFACVGILNKSTGSIINVDGGMANAFVR